MKASILVAAFLFSVAYSMAQEIPQATPENFKKLEWLPGVWNRTNPKPGTTGQEVWEKKSAQELSGWFVTLNGKDTTFSEKFTIIEKDNKLYYVATVIRGDNVPVSFLITSLTDVDFVCENPQHDFPKKIEYHLKGNQLHAAISGDGRSIPFLFERKK
ncbi:hypothetical protein HHL16_01765 [Pseudoflavitalea sp. G-6-1-2]|uniref:DUF6265 family protein n=1 Tax=Pseudoflavitalea sp. G-6-1-2 TaxID=2728841 RepID=UPI00146C4C96|nr:DUF6265 family protein [Pseudoflavitalea sp. G-6-1-2]NML19576.1 hypothetical protein [Pseudoflavitalea sp. G-6-1-2]